MAAPTQAKYGGQEFTWDQLVKKVGLDRARVEAPELDPKYQQMVAKEGQAKGSEAYTKQFIDPQTLGDTTKMFSTANLLQGIGVEEQGHGLLGLPGKALGTLGKAEYDIGNLVGSPTKAPPPADPKAGGPSTTKSKTTTAPPQNPFEQAETQLFNSLVGQYQSAMNIVNPYMSGANAAQYATSAQNVGNAFAGGGVQAQDPRTAGIIGKDLQAYQAANQAGTQGVQNAIASQGPANAAAMQAAPYQSILAALQSEAQYKTETGAGTPSLAGSTTTAPNATTDPYGAAIFAASSEAGTGTSPGATTVQSANAKVNPVNPGASTPTTDTSGSSGQAGGS